MISSAGLVLTPSMVAQGAPAHNRDEPDAAEDAPTVLERIRKRG